MAPSTTAKRQQLRDLCTSCQEIEDNFTRLEQLGGIEGLVRNILNLSWSTVAQGLADAAAVQSKRVEFGANALPETPRSTWMEEFIKCIKEDEIVQVLCVSAVVSLAIGTWENPNTGWIEGTAINMAVLIVGAVTATNETQSAEHGIDRDFVPPPKLLHTHARAHCLATSCLIPIPKDTAHVLFLAGNSKPAIDQR